MNAEDHTTIVEFDAGLGVLVRETDPNQRVTAWKHDGFGRLGRVVRPDGSQTTWTLSRTKDGGPRRDGWRVQQRNTTTGGADETAELDSLGRPIRWSWAGPTPPRPGGEPPRLMQKVVYDELGEHIARRSVPVSEGTPESELLYDVYEHDAVGRQVRHTTPWGAVETVEYDGLLVRATDAGGHVTVVEQDALGRNAAITDAANGITRYGYGPFGALASVEGPDREVTTMLRDALGRVRQLDDPDRGRTSMTHDGFGELLTSTDALGRKVTLEHDGLGRLTSRLDEHVAARQTTTWTWDSAEHGIGQLYQVTSPDGQKTYGYNRRGLLETTTLAIAGEREVLEARLGHDEVGRVETIAYPAPAGEAPFVVAHERDAHGYVLAVRDAATRFAYWRLTDVDSAGRFRSEVFGNDVVTERSYHDDKQRLERFVTRGDAGTVQDLSYDYDDRLDLKRRTDALQPVHRTERFRHDALHRLGSTVKARRLVLSLFFRAVLGVERIFHFEPLDDLGFAILSGGKKVMSRSRLGGLVRAVKTAGVKKFAQATEGLR